MLTLARAFIEQHGLDYYQINSIPHSLELIDLKTSRRCLAINQYLDQIIHAPYISQPMLAGLHEWMKPRRLTKDPGWFYLDYLNQELRFYTELNTPPDIIYKA